MSAVSVLDGKKCIKTLEFTSEVKNFLKLNLVLIVTLLQVTMALGTQQGACGFVRDSSIF